MAVQHSNIKHKVVVLMVALVLREWSLVSAAPAYSQGLQYYSDAVNGVRIANRNNYENSENIFYNNNLNNNYNNNHAYTTHSHGYFAPTANTIYSSNNNNNGYITHHPAGYSTTTKQSFIVGTPQHLSTSHYGYSAVPAADASHNSYSYSMPASGYGAGVGTAEGTDSSPALSALALLAFIYFLNMIQDVLQTNNSGRKRRALAQVGRAGRSLEMDEEEPEGHYITTYLEKEPAGEDDMGREIGEEQRTRGRSEGSVERLYSFLEDFFIRLPEILGLNKNPMIDRVGQENTPMGMGDFFSSRLQMISSIMSFLQDPSPSRVHRAVDGDTFGVPSIMGGKEMEYINDIREDKVEKTATARSERRRRHSPTTMNAWYQEMGGRNHEPEEGLGGVALKAVSLLGGGDLAQLAVRQEAAPALLELSKGLMGAHPHCLQRVLCRLTSHAGQLSLLPRVALQLLSSNMLDDKKLAMKAGLRGENCSQTFSECDTSKNENNTKTAQRNGSNK